MAIIKGNKIISNTYLKIINIIKRIGIGIIFEQPNVNKKNKC